MTCFWDGILNKLTNYDFKKFNINKPRNKEFVYFLKKHNTKTSNIKWNSKMLTHKQLEENFNHIKDFNPNTISRGYLCSTCEPFLFLISYLFDVNIDHNYCGHVMKYRINNSNRILIFKSNKRHFSS